MYRTAATAGGANRRTALEMGVVCAKLLQCQQSSSHWCWCLCWLLAVVVVVVSGGRCCACAKCKDEVATLDAEVQKWHGCVSGVVQWAIGVNMDARHRGVHGGQPPCAGDARGKPPEEFSIAAADLKAEIASILRDARDTHVGFAVQPSIAVCCVASVKSREMFKTAGGGRVVYVYALDCAYDQRRPKPGRFKLKQQHADSMCATLIHIRVKRKRNHLC